MASIQEMRFMATVLNTRTPNYLNGDKQSWMAQFCNAQRQTIGSIGNGIEQLQLQGKSNIGRIIPFIQKQMYEPH